MLCKPEKTHHELKIKAWSKRIQHFHPTSKNGMLDEMLDSFKHFQNLQNL